VEQWLKLLASLEHSCEVDCVDHIFIYNVNWFEWFAFTQEKQNVMLLFVEQRERKE